MTSCSGREEKHKIILPPSGVFGVVETATTTNAVITLDMSNNSCTQTVGGVLSAYPDLWITRNSQIGWTGAFTNASLTVQAITIEFAPTSVQSSSIGTPFRNPDGSPKYLLSGPTIAAQSLVITDYSDYYRFASVVLTGSDGKNYACANMTLIGVSTYGVHVQQ